MTVKKVMQLIPQNALPKKAVDISYYQGDVDFVKMKKAGIEAVIIRAGYGTTVDKRFVSYINAAIRAGLAIGVYWFIYATGVAGIKKNVEKCLEVIEPYRQYITLGVWCDWEYDSDKRAGTLSAAARSNYVDMFCRWIEDGGYEAGIYSNQDYIQSGKFQPWLIEKYPLWFAKYSGVVGKYAYTGKSGRPYIWQYSSTGEGKMYGVSSSAIDLDNVYIDLTPDGAVPPADIVSTDPAAIRASDNPYPEPTRTIYYIPGRSVMYGDDVKWVQWHLWRFGLLMDGNGSPDTAQIDGKWGPASDRALGIAQERLGLQPDKKCGPKTREKFKSV